MDESMPCAIDLSYTSKTCTFIKYNMEGTPRTSQSDVMHFCIIAIETAAKKMNVTPRELTQRLERQGLIDGRLIRFYDTLHTQSADYVADDIIETLNNYENDTDR